MAYCEDCPLGAFASGLLGNVMARKGKAPVSAPTKGKNAKDCKMPCRKVYEELRPGILMERPTILLAKRLGLSAQNLGTLARLMKHKAK